MKCPKCGKEPVYTGTKYGPRYDCCGLRSWGKGEPLVDAATHGARQEAHAAFDPLWKSGKMTRRTAYVRLSKAMGITFKCCHIKQMDQATAAKVPNAVIKIALEV